MADDISEGDGEDKDEDIAVYTWLCNVTSAIAMALEEKEEGGDVNDTAEDEYDECGGEDSDVPDEDWEEEMYEY